MAWLHSWSGLVVCWVLFLVFCGGTASYFKEEITLWMKPELHRAAFTANPRVDEAQAAGQALRYLAANAGNAERWFISLPGERRGAVSVLWTPRKSAIKGEAPQRRFETRLLDPVTGAELSARDTRGGEFLYRLHFDLHYMPALWARWIIGFCAMVMLVAIISGIITHRRIFQDIFTFRTGKGQRSWLDAHNATAVLALPFHLMITYTGLVSLMFMYMPWGIQAAYPSDKPAFEAEVFGRAPRPKPSGQSAALTPIEPLLAQASRHWNGAPAGRIAVSQPGDANAVITVTRAAGRDMASSAPSVVFDGVTGKLVSTFNDEAAPANETRGVMVGLHIAHFAPDLLRALFFVCGLAGCAMVATGAVLWGVRTRQGYAKALANGGRIGFGLRLVDALNIGAIAGLPIAFATYFWANRLLPAALAQRTEMEIRCFFAAWAIAAVLAQIRPTRGMWRLQLWTAAALFGGIPLLNVFTTDSHLGVTLLQGQGPAAVAGFDLTTLALGGVFACAAWKLGRRGARAARVSAGAAVGTTGVRRPA
jgi:uncharacterized iron-regulated membrane protein